MNTFLTTLSCIFFSTLCLFQSVRAMDSELISICNQSIDINYVDIEPIYCDDCTGTISIYLSQYCSGIEYSIDSGVTWQNSNYFEDVCFGVYLVIVREKNNPSNSSSKTIEVDNLIDFEPELSMTCSEHSFSALVDIKTHLGISYYKVSYYDPAGNWHVRSSGMYHFEFDIIHPESGDYQFYFEINGCVKTKTIHFDDDCLANKIKLLEPTITPAYCGLCNGSLKINILNEDPADFEYSLNAGLTWQNSSLFEGLCVDDYLLVARKRNNHELFGLTTTQIPNGPDPEFEIKMSCSDQSNTALVEITSNISNQGFKFSYNDPSGNFHELLSDTSQYHFTIPQAEVGLYFFNIDFKGCLNDYTVNFIEKCYQEVSIKELEVINSYCDLCNGSITIILEEGNDYDMEYSIDNGQTWQNENVFDNLCAGDYEIIARDKQYPLTPAISITYISNVNTSNHEIKMTCVENMYQAEVEIHTADGVTDFKISYTDPLGEYHELIGDTTDFVFTIDIPQTGDYIFNIENNLDGCIKSNHVFFEELCLSSVDIKLEDPEITGAYCGDCNGTMAILVNQGISQFVEYSIDQGATWQNSNYFENLCIDNYLIFVRNKYDHNIIVVTTIQIPNAPELEILTFDYECNSSENSLEAIVEVKNGTADYHLKYNNPQGEEIDLGTSYSDFIFGIENVIIGDYHFFVEDRLSCVKDTIISITEECVKTPTPVIEVLQHQFLISYTIQEGSIKIRINQIVRDEEIMIKVFSSTGKLVFHSHIHNSTSWSKNINLQPGTYFIVANSSTGQKKVSKQFVF